MNLCVIPARGGSKRIPKKNIKRFHGKPMICWSIETALKSGLFDAVVVSTDNKKIAQVAKKAGAEAPFLRPRELSNDHATTLPVIAHAIRWWEKNRGKVDLVCCLYATAPFLKIEFLQKGLNVLKKKPEAEFAFGVTSFAFTIFRAIKISKIGYVKMFWPENELIRSQDLPEVWHDAGQFYWGTKKAFLKNRGVFSARSRAVILQRQRQRQRQRDRANVS